MLDNEVTCCGHRCICTEMCSQASRHRLPTTAYVSIAEVLSWIAFGDAIAAADLRAMVAGHRQPATDSPEEKLGKFFARRDKDAPQVPGIDYFHDRQAGLAKLTEAWRQMREEVDRGNITVRGRHSATYSLADARMADVVELTGALLATYSQFDVSTGGVRRQLEGSPDVLCQDDPHSFDREVESFGDDMRAADGYFMVEVERDGVARRWPRPVKAPRKSHEEIVAWCNHWMASGKGNGHDKAWKDFQALPEHHGLSRDHVFRPAWKDAKLSQT